MLTLAQQYRKLCKELYGAVMRNEMLRHEAFEKENEFLNENSIVDSYTSYVSTGWEQQYIIFIDGSAFVWAWNAFELYPNNDYKYYTQTE